MELKFLGRGAAFNPKEGNNSAYFISNNELFLIDSGETTFERLIKKDILSSVNEVNLMITHTHSDHIGSLGSLAAYIYYILHKRLNIILPKNPEYLDNIQSILDSFGTKAQSYKYIDESEFDDKYDEFKSIRFIKTKHTDELKCYGLIFETDDGIIYYSGDTREIRILDELIKSGKKIDKVYIDTTTANYEGNVHLYIGILEDFVPKEDRNKIYCMHLNSDECINRALKDGFNVVEDV